MTKTAFITGITGQDGSYLTELLLEKGYNVHGLIRRSATASDQNISHLLGHERLNLHYGGLTDALSIYQVLKIARPDEIYNLAAQSDVKISFDTPVETADINALGTMRILEAMKQLDMMGTTKFYQASTSELYGAVKEIPQTETTPFHPRSPYGVSKLYAYWGLLNYKESYNLFGCNGILFNHESPRRGTNFVTRKITSQIGELMRGERTEIELGNIDSRRDWGHAKDYVRGMWQMMQHDTPDDYVLATGETRTIREFVESAFKHVDVNISWDGSGLQEVGIVGGRKTIKINPAYYRPAEVDLLIGCPTKAETVLGWEREFTFDQLVADMMQNDLTK
jgi:GDPmannose 4,6-dehydratase